MAQLDGDVQWCEFKIGAWCRMSVSMHGVVQRDEMVFQHALDCQCPISMVLSGGYAADSHEAVAASIKNLMTTFKLNVTI